MDFNPRIYMELLTALQSEGFLFLPFGTFNKGGGTISESNSFMILRHDIDARKENSLSFARIQHDLGITGTYYFRIVPKSFDEAVIREISSLDHEIGYHYETMDTSRGDVDKAYDEFCRNLEKFRRIVHIETICMHGSPLSKFDNRAIWKKYDYRKLGLIAEPYFDLNFNEIAYYTDTGRRWDGEKVSVRDRSINRTEQVKGQTHMDNSWPVYHSTHEIIRAVKAGTFPSKSMMTFHPQRWTDKALPWVKEYIAQKAKNVVKYWLIKMWKQ